MEEEVGAGSPLPWPPLRAPLAEVCVGSAPES